MGTTYQAMERGRVTPLPSRPWTRSRPSRRGRVRRRLGSNHGPPPYPASGKRMNGGRTVRPAVANYAPPNRGLPTPKRGCTAFAPSLARSSTPPSPSARACSPPHAAGRERRPEGHRHPPVGHGAHRRPAGDRRRANAIIIAAGAYRIYMGVTMDVHDELDLLHCCGPGSVGLPALGEVGLGVGIGLVGCFMLRRSHRLRRQRSDRPRRRAAATGTETWGLLVVFAVGAGFVAYGILPLPSRTDEAVATAEARLLPPGSPSEWLFGGQRFSRAPGASVACREVTEHERRDFHVAEESRVNPGVFRRLTRHITAATGSAGVAAVVVGAAAGWLVLGAITDFPLGGSCWLPSACPS